MVYRSVFSLVKGILVKLSVKKKKIFMFSNVKSLAEYVVKILALILEPKKVMAKEKKFHYIKMLS